MNKDLSRKEKINFLKGMLKGEKKIHELLPMEVIVFDVLDNGNYHCKEMNKEFTKQEYEKYNNKFPHKLFVEIHRVLKPYN